ncbi:putative nuclease HARBI1 [Ixodes scapularis]
MTDSTESTAALASLQLILGLLESSDSSDSESSDSDEDDGDTSSSSSSDDEAAVLGEVFAETFALPAKRPKITRYVEDVLRAYSDEEFRRNFRLQREPAYAVIERYERSAYYRGSIHGGSNPKTAEVCILSFLWYAGNKTCIRDVAGRFDMGESTLSRILNRVAEFLCSIAPDEIRFPDDVAALAKDFEEVSGFPGVVGCVDGSYIGIRCPDNKCIDAGDTEIRDAELEELRRQELLRVDSRGSPEEDLPSVSLSDAALRVLGRIKRDRMKVLGLYGIFVGFPM